MNTAQTDCGCGPSVSKTALVENCGPLLAATCCGNPSSEYFALEVADPAHEFATGMVVAFANDQRTHIKPATAPDDVVVGLFKCVSGSMNDGTVNASVYTGNDATFHLSRVIFPEGVPNGPLMDQLRARSFKFVGVN